MCMDDLVVLGLAVCPRRPAPRNLRFASHQMRVWQRTRRALGANQSNAEIERPKIRDENVGHMGPTELHTGLTGPTGP